MSLTELHITLESEIADAIKRFESESAHMVVDLRIDRYEGREFCIGATLAGTSTEEGE